MSQRPAATLNRNCPSASVSTVREPIASCAPLTAWPDTASTTRPVTAIDWPATVPMPEPTTTDMHRTTPVQILGSTVASECISGRIDLLAQLDQLKRRPFE